MDIKVTFDITPALADLAGRLCDALKSNAARIPAHCIPAPAPTALKWDTPEKAENPPAERPAAADVLEPAPSPENVTDAKTDATAHELSAAQQGNEVVSEVVSEDAKPKRVRKKSDAPKAEPAPKTTETPAEPEPAEAPKDDPAPATEAEPEPAPEPADAPEMTLDEIRAVCVQAAKAGKTNVVTGYLNANGATSLSKLDPALYPKLADIVKAAL